MNPEDEAKKVLSDIYIQLDRQISPKTEEYNRLLEAAVPYVGRAAVAKARCKNVMDLMKCLNRNAHIGIRKLDPLKEMLKKADLQDLSDDIVGTAEKEIQRILGNSKEKENNNGLSRPELNPDTDGSGSAKASLSEESSHEVDGTPNSVPGAVAAERAHEPVTIDASGVPPNPDGSGAVYPGQKGYVLILSYKENRAGNQFDVDGLEKFFEDQLSYKVVIKEDLTKTDVEIQLKKTREQLTFKKYDFFFLIVLAHGEKDGIIRLQRNKKVEKITLDEIIDEFRGSSMETLVGSPRVFIIQACCGQGRQEGMETDEPIDDPQKTFLPRDANLLIVCATTPGYVAFRDRNKGTVFIQELLKVFHKHYMTKHLETMLTIVKRNVAEGHGTETDKQMPCTWSTLTKDLYLRPNDK